MCLFWCLTKITIIQLGEEHEAASSTEYTNVSQAPKTETDLLDQITSEYNLAKSREASSYQEYQDLENRLHSLKGTNPNLPVASEITE